jgi:protein-disulfide isomerase
MSAWQTTLALFAGPFFAVGCQPPSANDPSQAAIAANGLPGVETSSLTRSERDVWAELVTEQLAPCPSVAKSIADCVRQNAACEGCRPAAEQLAQQLRRGKTKGQAEQAFRIRFTDNGVVPVDLDGSPSKGPDDATVTIVEWADFECAFCAKVAPTLEQILAAHPGQVRLVFKHFPLDMHLHAAVMSKACIAAGKQGKFWEMHAAMFAVQGAQLDEPAIRKLALGMQLDPDKLVSDMQAPDTADRLARDRAQADKLGLKGTPFIVINSRRFDLSSFDFDEDLRPWIELELQLASKETKKP